MDNTKIVKIPIMKAIDIITNLEPKGLFISKAGGQILAIDNSTGDSYTHKFIDENKAIKWLRNEGKETVRSFRKGIYENNLKQILVTDIVSSKDKKYVLAMELHGTFKKIIIPYEMFLTEKSLDGEYKYKFIEGID